MLHLNEVLALQEGEKIVSVLRRSLLIVAPTLLAAALFFATPFFFLFPLLRLGFVGTVLLCIAIAMGAYLGLKAILVWDANVLVLTDRRLVVVRQSGLWSRQVIEAPLAGCQTAPQRKGIPGMLGIGTLVVSGQGLSAPVTVIGVPGVERVARMIHGLRDAQGAGFKVRPV